MVSLYLEDEDVWVSFELFLGSLSNQIEEGEIEEEEIEKGEIEEGEIEEGEIEEGENEEGEIEEGEIEEGEIEEGENEEGEIEKEGKDDDKDHPSELYAEEENSTDSEGNESIVSNV